MIFDDHVVKPRFDGSDVTKGFKDIQNKFERLKSRSPGTVEKAGANRRTAQDLKKRIQEIKGLNLKDALDLKITPIVDMEMANKELAKLERRLKSFKTKLKVHVEYSSDKDTKGRKPTPGRKGSQEALRDRLANLKSDLGKAKEAKLEPRLVINISKAIKELEQRFEKLEFKKKVDLEMKEKSSSSRGSSTSGSGNSSKAKSKESPPPRDRPLSVEGRVGLESRITRTRDRLAGIGSRLAGRTDKDSVAKIAQIQEEMQNLDRLQRKLQGITKKNSQAYAEFYKNLSITGTNTSRLNRETSALVKKLGLSSRLTQSFSNSLHNLAGSYVSVFAVLSGVAGLVRSGRDLEDTSSVMLLAAGNASLAAKEMEFVGELSDKVKIRVADLTRNYAKFAVAGRTAGLSTEVIRKNFEDLSIAIRSTGLAQDRANLTFLGFQQILAGPVVQAQEMNQIIEQMPQFAGLAAKALKEMGFEAENYRNAIATGTVDSQQFVAIVTRMMREQAVSTGAFKKSLETVTAASGDFRNILDKMTRSLFEAGLSNTLIKLLNGMGNVITAVTPLLQALVWTIDKFVSAIAASFDGIDKFVQLLGGDEGTGVTWAIRVLALVIGSSIIPMMVKWHLRNITALASLLGLKAGTDGLTFSLKKLKFAWKSLLISTGIGALLAGGSFLIEKLFLGSEPKREESFVSQKTAAKDSFVSNSPVTNNQIHQEFHTSRDLDEFSMMQAAERSFSGALTS